MMVRLSLQRNLQWGRLILFINCNLHYSHKHTVYYRHCTFVCMFLFIRYQRTFNLTMSTTSTFVNIIEFLTGVPKIIVGSNLVAVLLFTTKIGEYFIVNITSGFYCFWPPPLTPSISQTTIPPLQEKARETLRYIIFNCWFICASFDCSSCRKGTQDSQVIH